MSKVRTAGAAVALMALTVAFVVAQLSPSAGRDASANEYTNARYAVAEHDLGDTVFTIPGSISAPWALPRREGRDVAGL